MLASLKEGAEGIVLASLVREVAARWRRADGGSGVKMENAMKKGVFLCPL